MDVPAGRPVAVPVAKAVVAKPTYITWSTPAFMTSASPRRGACWRSWCQFAMTIFYYPTLLGFVASGLLKP